VEQAAINHVANDKNPIYYGDAKEWKELTDRREKFGRPDNRTRTEEELRIEKSLGNPVSLRFQQAPLSEVVRHIATTANINVVLDNLGLEEEGVSTDTPVSIEVNGIMLK